jgi:hypothetical protein
MEHFARRAYGEQEYWMLCTMPLPSLIIIFFISPFVLKLYALFRSVAAIEPVMMSKTLAYMKEERELKEQVVNTLKSVRNSFLPGP